MITRHRNLSVLTLSLLSLPALLAACDDQFTSGSVINRMRLLGAKVIIDVDHERAWVRPGDDGRVDFSLALPDFAADDPRRVNPDMSLDPRFPKDPMANVRSMFLSCTNADIGTGQAQCAEVLFLFQLYQQYQSGQLGGDAGMPDAGAPAPVISQKDIDATFAALKRGVGCDDRFKMVGTLDDPNDDIPDDDIPDYFGNAAAGIRQIPLTTQPAQLVCDDGAPSTPLKLAADYVGPDRLIQGVICEYGEPVFQLDPPYFACRYKVGDDPALPNRAPTAEIFTFTVGVEQEGNSNHHPKFAINDPIGIANATGALPKPMPGAWHDVPAPEPVLVPNPNGGPDKLLDCTTETDPTHIRDYGRKSEVTLAIAADREVTNEDPLRKEAYQVETFATDGELDRQFSIVDDLDPVVADGTDGQKAVISVVWDHGKLPSPARNTLARFYFLIRDGRGGFEFQTRWMCLCRGGSCK